MPSYQGLLARREVAAIVELIKSLRDVRTATSPPATAPQPHRRADAGSRRSPTPPEEP